MDEIEEAIPEEHPELKRGDVLSWCRSGSGRWMGRCTERQAWELLCQLFLAGWLSRMP